MPSARRGPGPSRRQVEMGDGTCSPIPFPNPNLCVVSSIRPPFPQPKAAHRQTPIIHPRASETFSNLTKYGLLNHNIIAAMDEKRTPVLAPLRGSPGGRWTGRTQSLIRYGLLALFTYCLYRQLPSIDMSESTHCRPHLTPTVSIKSPHVLVKQDPEGEEDLGRTPASGALIPLEAHIMSKCPDAKARIPQLLLLGCKATDSVGLTAVVLLHRTASARWSCRRCRGSTKRSTLRCPSSAGKLTDVKKKMS